MIIQYIIGCYRRYYQYSDCDVEYSDIALSNDRHHTSTHLLLGRMIASKSSKSRVKVVKCSIDTAMPVRRQSKAPCLSVEKGEKMHSANWLGGTSEWDIHLNYVKVYCILVHLINTYGIFVEEFFRTQIQKIKFQHHHNPFPLPSLSLDTSKFDTAATITMVVSIYTPEQQKALFWAVKVPACVSIACSSLCIYHLFAVDEKKSIRKVYGRLWFLISVTNIMVALFCMLAGLATPADTGIYGAFGNEASCKAVGASFMFIFVVCMGYNAALAMYFFISIHTKWTEREFARKVEPWLHAVPCIYAIIGVIVGLTTDMFATNDVLLYCWAAPSPFGCRYEGGCVSGDSYRDVFVFAAGLVEMNIITSLKVFGTFALSYTVSKQQRKMQAKYHAKTTGNTIAKETRVQAALFFMACVVPYVLMIFLRVADLYFWEEENVKTKGFFWFSIISQCMLPVQGCMNMVCYFRPKVREYQRKCQEPSVIRSSFHVVRARSMALSNSERRKNPYAAPGGTYGGKPLISNLTASARSNNSDAERPNARDDLSPSERDEDVVEDLDDNDIAYLDVDQLERACPDGCSFTLGEDMIGDARKSIMSSGPIALSTLDMKLNSSDLRSKEQKRSGSALAKKRVLPPEDDSTAAKSETHEGDDAASSQSSQTKTARILQTGEVIEHNVPSS